MKIVLLGANGRTGREVMRLALAAGHSVTGIVRSAHSLGNIQQEGLRIEVGNVCDPAFLKTVLAGHDAVISTLGPRLPTRSACRIYPDSATSIAAAMQAAGLKRVIVTSTALLFSPTRAWHKALRLIARNNRDAAGLMEEILRKADLDWTFVRVGFLHNKNQGQVLKASDAMPGESDSISRHAVAEFLLEALQQSSHVRGVVGLCETRLARIA